MRIGLQSQSFAIGRVTPQDDSDSACDSLCMLSRTPQPLTDVRRSHVIMSLDLICGSVRTTSRVVIQS
uniref:Uncharacterized protein n=1 Tax=Ascaris lumbricoides TaxID=6252 RepID=A0A0M3HQH3_ASCLU